jgi:hypothetical protein
MAEVTFRDFAAAIMKGDAGAASAALQPLLGLDPAAAQAATQHFQAQSAAAGPAFMAKAMGLRTALASALELDIYLESAGGPERAEFDRIRREQGLAAALAWRDKR